MSLRVLRPALSLAAVALTTVGLTACGSSSTSTSTTPAATGTPSAAGQGPGGIDLAAIQKCLSAAGISMPSGMPTGPSGMPTGTPSGMPSGTPSAMPSGRPSGIPSGAPTGMLNDPKVQAALKACGISMPTGAPTTS